MSKETGVGDRVVRPGTQTTTFWIDESGSKSTAGRCFVVAGIKTRHPDELQRAIKSVRERTSFASEFKFTRLSAGSYRPMTELIDALEQSDAHLVATVVDSTHNPFKRREVWDAQAAIIAQLIRGNLNRNEIAVAMIDGISTPPGVALGTAVKRRVNSQLGASSLVTAVSLDSKTNDLLQAADLVAGAIRFQRVREGVKTEKVQIAARLAAAFGVADLSNQRTKRVNIATLKGHSQRPLEVISSRTSAS